MDKFINRLIDEYLRVYLDKSRNKLALSDKIYKKDLKDSKELEKRYAALSLDTEERTLIDDYIACLLTRAQRMEELSYVIGVRDATKFLNAIGLLKGSKKNLKKYLKNK